MYRAHPDWNSREALHAERVFRALLVDLGKQLKPLIEEFHGSEALRTCKECRSVFEAPAKA